MRIKIYWIGKTRNASIRALIADYLERTRHFVPCEGVEMRDPSRTREPGGADPRSRGAAEIRKLLDGGQRTVALDGKGKEFTSREFASWLESELNRGTRGISFVIGGPEGLADWVLERADLSLSLGRMTWTHEMCRVLLLEQLYRALSILRNIPYHK
jgi:23S rRNA (pseudouridine1915-N3)-methyltransferase